MDVISKELRKKSFVCERLIEILRSSYYLKSLRKFSIDPHPNFGNRYPYIISGYATMAMVMSNYLRNFASQPNTRLAKMVNKLLQTDGQTDTVYERVCPSVTHKLPYKFNH